MPEADGDYVQFNLGFWSRSLVVAETMKNNFQYMYHRTDLAGLHRPYSVDETCGNASAWLTAKAAHPKSYRRIPEYLGR